MTEAPSDALLYGHDPTEGIVAVHRVSPSAVRVYRREAEDRVVWTDEAVHPFLFLSDIGWLDGFPRDRYRFQDLSGEGFFRVLCVFPDQGAYWDALRHVEKTTDTGKSRPDEVYLPGGLEQQYLTQTGRTLFKGMPFEQLKRLQFDLEVYGPTGFPQAEVAEHRILLIALSDSTGWSRLVGAPGMDEDEVIQEALDLIVERDPDVIEAHNGFGFDWPYLMARARRHSIRLKLGRDGSEPRTFPSSVRFAERQIEFDAVEIAGRHTLDTLFQTMAFDVIRRDLPDYTLKGAARYFGFAAEDRTYIDGRDIASVWDTEPERVMAYALDDAYETRALAAHLSGSTYYLTQMVPMPYGQAARTGPAAKIESLFVRGYLHARQALPRANFGSQVVGGYTDVFVTGVIGPVVYADVESLYPSIMLAYDVQPAGDTLGLFPTLLRRLTELRFATKDAMRAADGSRRGELDARQNAYKIVINSFYGNMGFGYALFNDFAEADRVAATGQELLRQMMRLVRDAGGLVVEVDTDGILFVPPEGVRGEAPERAFVEALTADMPDGIRVGFDGRYERMLSYKKKNYALQSYDGTITFKGSSLVSRSVERFGREFLRDAVRLLLAEDVKGLHACYLAARSRIQAHDWRGVESFQRVETLKSTVAEYERAVSRGERTRTAAYELAEDRARETGQPVRRGERIAYYIAEGGRSGRAFEFARLASAWDPKAPDEDTGYYLDRLDTFAARFGAFFETDAMFRLVFSEEDLFGFDASQVRLAVTVREPETLEDDVPF